MSRSDPGPAAGPAPPPAPGSAAAAPPPDPAVPLSPARPEPLGPGAAAGAAAGAARPGGGRAEGAHGERTKGWDRSSPEPRQGGGRGSGTERGGRGGGGNGTPRVGRVRGAPPGAGRRLGHPQRWAGAREGHVGTVKAGAGSAACRPGPAPPGRCSCRAGERGSSRPRSPHEGLLPAAPARLGHRGRCKVRCWCPGLLGARWVPPC